MTQTSILADTALMQIERLLTNFDLGGQIESALPLLQRHRRTLTKLRDALHRAIEIKCLR